MQTNPSIQTVAADLTREVARTVAFVASASPPERHDWKPLENGRSIREQVIECSLANRKWSRILSTREWWSPSESVTQEALLKLDSLEKAAAELLSTAETLAQTILSVPDADMTGAIDGPWGLYPLPRCCLHAYWNMVYHEGQINYVQTLYGDFDEHEPE